MQNLRSVNCLSQESILDNFSVLTERAVYLAGSREEVLLLN